MSEMLSFSARYSPSSFSLTSPFREYPLPRTPRERVPARDSTVHQFPRPNPFLFPCHVGSSGQSSIIPRLLVLMPFPPHAKYEYVSRTFLLDRQPPSRITDDEKSKRRQKLSRRAPLRLFYRPHRDSVRAPLPYEKRTLFFRKN